MFLKNKVCQPHGEVKPNKNQLKYTPQNLSKSNMTMETQAFEDVSASDSENGDFPLLC